MKKILIFVNDFKLGGVTSLIQTIYRKIDRKKYQISFVRQNIELNNFDDEIKRNGDSIFYFQNYRLNKIPFLNYYSYTKKMVDQIVSLIGKTNKYDVAYIHAVASIAVPVAKKLGIKNIIIHSHEAITDFHGNENSSLITRLLWKQRKKVYNSVRYKVGDSINACKAKFGDDVVNDKRMFVVHPPIDLDMFNPANYSADEFCKKYNVCADKFNLIHVGRLCEIKNQSFLIDIVSCLKKQIDCHLYIKN